MPQARRGELWVIDLGMAQKPRPCLILSIVLYFPSILNPVRVQQEVLKFGFKFSVFQN